MTAIRTISLFISTTALSACGMVGKSGAVKTYEEFAAAWARNDVAEASRLSEGAQVQATLEQKSVARIMWVSVQDYRGVRFEIVSEKEAGEDVELEATVTMDFNPPGVESAIGSAMYAKFRHRATLRKTQTGWRVVSFEPEFITAEEKRR